MLIFWLKYIFVAFAIAILLGTRRYRSGTTLVAPGRWALAALLAVTAVEFAIDCGYLNSSRAAAWRYLSATSTLCPGIALLGAKRPQNRPWQWVVASLWLVLSLPAIQTLAMGKTTALDIHPARAVFLDGLILFCAANSMVSRYWPAVLIVVAAQLHVLNPSWIALSKTVGGSLLSGPILLSAATLLAFALHFRRRSTQPLDAVWFDFRDWFGMVWALRMMEQINLVAQSNQWDVRLRWSGFHGADGSRNWDLPAEQQRVLRQSLQNLLRRFVSAEWIAARLHA